MTGEDKLNELLARHFSDSGPNGASDGEAAARVLAALARPLPRQRHAWRHWPAVLLNWDFAPAWPRLVALASCAALGFAVGVVGPSFRHDGMLSPHRDFQLASVLSEPEIITGALP
jgi:hypothetical protein